MTEKLIEYLQTRQLSKEVMVLKAFFPPAAQALQPALQRVHDFVVPTAESGAAVVGVLTALLDVGAETSRAAFVANALRELVATADAVAADQDLVTAIERANAVDRALYRVLAEERTPHADA